MCPGTGAGAASCLMAPPELDHLQGHSCARVRTADLLDLQGQKQHNCSPTIKQQAFGCKTGSQRMEVWRTLLCCGLSLGGGGGLPARDMHGWQRVNLLVLLPLMMQMHP